MERRVNIGNKRITIEKYDNGALSISDRQQSFAWEKASDGSHKEKLLTKFDAMIAEGLSNTQTQIEDFINNA